MARRKQPTPQFVRCGIVNRTAELTEIQKNLPSTQEGLTREVSDQTTDIDLETIQPSTKIMNNLADNTPTKVLERQYTVSEFTINPGWATPVDIHFPGALLAVPTIRDYLATHKYFTAGVRISVKVNSTIYHEGMMQASFVHDRLPVPLTLNNAERSACNGVYFNYSTSDSAIMEHHWTSPASATDLANPNLAAIGTLSLAPLIALYSTSENENITVSVQARFVKPYVAGYRVTPPAVRQSEQIDKTVNNKLTSSYQDQPEPGILKKAGTIMSDIEDLGDLITGGILDKPTKLDAAQKIRYDDGPELISGTGASVAVPMQMYPDFKLKEVKFEGRHFTTHRSLRDLSQMPMLHHLQDASAAAFTTRIPLNPMFLGNQNTTTNAGDVILTPDYLWAMGFTHQYWRGSIRYHIKIVTGSFTTGRMRISYINNDPPDSFGGDNPSITLNVRGTTVFNLAVPYVWPTLMQATSDLAPLTSPALYFEWLSPPTCSQGTPRVYLVLFRAGGKDTLFAQPKSNIYTPPAERQSKLTKEFSRKFEAFSREDSYVSLVGVTTTEQTHRIGDLFKRYTEFDITEEPDTIALDVFKYQFDNTFNAGLILPQAYISSMFKYVRGGMRLGFVYAATDTDMRAYTISDGSGPDVGAGVFWVNTANQKTAYIEMPYMAQHGFLNKTNDIRFLSPFPGNFSQIHYDAPAHTYMAFADDRYFFYLLPPPRIVVPVPTKAKKVEKQKEQLSRKEMISKKKKERI